MEPTDRSHASRGSSVATRWTWDARSIAPPHRGRAQALRTKGRGHRRAKRCPLIGDTEKEKKRKKLGCSDARAEKIRRRRPSSTVCVPLRMHHRAFVPRPTTHGRAHTHHMLYQMPEMPRVLLSPLQRRRSCRKKIIREGSPPRRRRVYPRLVPFFTSSIRGAVASFTGDPAA